MNDLLEFFTITERLHYEQRTLQLSNGEKESVAAHAWAMSLLAIVFAPRLKKSVNIEKVLKLIAVHDLAEAEVGDIQLHEQIKNPDRKSDKHRRELAAMNKFHKMAGAELYDLWYEYEQRKTPESRFVKALDQLQVDLAISCAKDLGYVGEYDNNFYWRMFFSESRLDPFRDEPALLEFLNAIRSKTEIRMRNELGMNPDDFR